LGQLQQTTKTPGAARKQIALHDSEKVIFANPYEHKL